MSWSRGSEMSLEYNSVLVRGRAVIWHGFNLESEFKMQSIKAVLFDLDGVLVRSFTTEPLPGAKERIAALKAQGIPMAICTNQAGPIWGQATGQEKYPLTETIAANIKTIIGSLGLGGATGLDGIPWFVSIGDERVLGMMDRDQYDFVTEVIKIHLDEALFDVDVRIETEAAWRKPAPDMLLAAAKYLGVEPADCLYVGDMETDRQAAVAAGMQFEMV